MNNYRNKVICIAICFIEAVVVSFAQKSLTLKHASSPIILDGLVNDIAWNSIPYFELLQSIGDLKNKNNECKFKMTYDDKYLYVFVDVKDEILDTSQSVYSWEKDCIELFLSMDTTAVSNFKSGINGVYQTRKVFGRELTFFKEKGFNAAEYRTGSGYSQEWKLPFDSLTSTLKNKWNRKNFRFECLNIDNDGKGRQSMLFFNNYPDDDLSGFVQNYWAYINLENFLIVDKKEIPSIKVEVDKVEFGEESDYELFNVNGITFKKGSSLGFSTAGIKAGIYILKVNDKVFKLSIH